MTHRGVIVVIMVGLVLLVGAAGSAWAGLDPLDLNGSFGTSAHPALFGSVYRYDPAGGFVDTWIWLSLISQDGVVHIQFYDPKCTRTDDQTFELTENESTLLFASEAVPDATAGVFLVEASCVDPFASCALLGQLWYLDFDDGIVFVRPLYSPLIDADSKEPIPLNVRFWSLFQHEHWDTVVNGFGLFAAHLWLNCPTGRGAPGTAGNTALYDDLVGGRLFPVPFGALAVFDFPGLPGAALADFLLINFDETPGGSRDDVPCACLTDGPITSFSGLFADFFGLTRVKFKTATGGVAVGLVHKTEGVPGLQIFDKRFTRFQAELEL